jgi:purine-binding chemotaxis protein CheW
MSEELRSQGVEKLLTFTLAGELFALDIGSVREILDYTEITKIPQTPEFMRGVVNLRGNAIPVIDLRLKFGLGATERTLNTRIIIIEVVADGEMTVLGSMADSVKEVYETESGRIDPPPRMGAKINTAFIRGIGKKDDKFIIVLDIGKVFSEEELSSVREPGAALESPGAAA